MVIFCVGFVLGAAFALACGDGIAWLGKAYRALREKGLL
jgi:hypothetical protein